jgi:hypothetical protein
MARKQSAMSPGIFSKADYQTLIDERRNLNDMITTLEKAEQCGMDCAIFKQMRSDIDSQLAAIHQHFMNPPPTT